MANRYYRSNYRYYRPNNYKEPNYLGVILIIMCLVMLGVVGIEAWIP